MKRTSWNRLCLKIKGNIVFKKILSIIKAKKKHRTFKTLPTILSFYIASNDLKIIINIVIMFIK